MKDRLTILHGDALAQLQTLPSESVQMCVTSPPYWGLRDYNVAGQIGLEKTPDEYVSALVAVFSEVRRVLRNDGTLWLNVGDSYAGGNTGNQTNVGQRYGKGKANNGHVFRKDKIDGFKPKDLIGIPWLLAFALRNDGWYLRSEITWCKKAPMPESVKDRPTCATEKIFLLSKSPKYYFNSDAVRTSPADGTARLERAQGNGYAYASGAFGQQPHSISQPRPNRSDKQRGHGRRHAGFNDRWDSMPKDEQQASGANIRNYWLLGPENFSEAHFAVFPSEIPRRAILAGSRAGDVVLDCFAGSGTSGMVAIELGRKAVLIELNQDYVQMIRQRCNVTPGLPLG